MANLGEIKFNIFQGQGMPDEERDLSNGNYRYLENTTYNDNARELKQIADVSVTTSTRNIIASLSLGGNIYGLGADADGKFCIWYYESNTWTSATPSNSATFQSITNPLFIYSGGYIYFTYQVTGSGYYNIGQFNISTHGFSVWISNAASGFMSGGCEWQGSLYGWYGNTIYKLTSGSSTSMNTVSTDQTMVDMIPYGNYLAVICTSSNNQSLMYIWDGITTTTYADIVAEGIGNVIGGALKDGVITIVIGGLNSKDLRIRQYISGVFSTVFYYAGRKNTAGSLYTYLISRVKLCRGFIYFLIAGTKPNSSDNYQVSLFRWGNKVSGTTNSFSAYKNFGSTSSTISLFCSDFCIIDDTTTNGDYFSVFSNLFVGTYEAKTGTTFTQSGLTETSIYTAGDQSIVKQIKSVDLEFAPLTSGQTVALQYRKDAETSWTTVFTASTAGDCNHTAKNIESTGDPLPAFREIAFRVLLTGGATLTGGKALYENQINDYGN